MVRIVSWQTFLLLLPAAIATHCAFDLAHVSYSPTRFTSTTAKAKIITLAEEVLITKAPCGYERTLLKGSRWEHIGTVPEGEVYKPLTQVLTVECSNVYQAHLVLTDNYLTGFYLPVEESFVSLPERVTLPVP